MEKSKGYAFGVFIEAIHVTVAIETLDGTVWCDCPVTVHQGVQKEAAAAAQAFLIQQTTAAKHAARALLSDVERAIQNGVGEVKYYYMDPHVSGHAQNTRSGSLVGCQDFARGQYQRRL